LIEIAYPDFQDSLVAEAKKLGLWDESKSFTKTSHKILYKSLPLIMRLKKMLSKKK
jgi:acyl-CoA hydrolase